MKMVRGMFSRPFAPAPWLAAAALAVLSALLPNRSELSAEGVARRAQIAAALERAPLFIGRWVGEDASDDVPEEARAMLHPNGVLSRTYRTPGSPPVKLLIVHCGDARDMIGHYPPICYPSAGWTSAQVPEHARDLVLRVNGEAFSARQYMFGGVTASGRAESLRVLSAFVLPEARIAMDMDDIHRQSERLALSVQGVAQVQVVTPGAMPLERAVQAAEELLGGLPEVLGALRAPGAAGSLSRFLAGRTL